MVGRHPAARRLLLLGLLVVLEVGWVLDQDPFTGRWFWVAAGAVVAVHGWLYHRERSDPRLPPRLVLAATVVVASAAVVAAPYGSHDLYQYAVYGRMVVDHHANPYLTGPSAFPHDALYPHLSAAWHGAPTVYGPLFTAFSSVAALGYGSSALGARLAFQGVAALSLVGGVAYLARREAGTAAMVFVGLSPVLVAAVNGGHNDVAAGVLVLVGVDLARRDRIGPSAVVLAAACLVKLLAAPAVAAVAVVLAVARRWREVARFVGLVAGLVVAAYLAVGGPRALRPLEGMGREGSRASMWLTFRGRPLPLAGWSSHLPRRPTEALFLVLAVAGVLIARTARLAVDPATLAVALGAVAVFGATYVLPWYPAAVLPVAVLASSRVPRRALWVGSSALLLAYVAPPGLRQPEGVEVAGAAHLCGFVLAAVVAVLAVGRLTPRQPGSEPGHSGSVPLSARS